QRRIRHRRSQHAGPGSSSEAPVAVLSALQLSETFIQRCGCALLKLCVDFGVWKDPRQELCTQRYIDVLTEFDLRLGTRKRRDVGTFFRRLFDLFKQIGESL